MQDQENTAVIAPRHAPWNKGKESGQSRPSGQNTCGRSGPSCKSRDGHATWRCSIWLSIASCVAAMSSPSRSRILLRVGTQSIVPQFDRKTGQPVRFESTEQTRQAVDDYMRAAAKKPGEFMFTGRRSSGRSITPRQYARLVSEWIASIGLDPHLFGTHSLRQTKATLIYRRTGNLRAVQLLLGHTKIESTARYLGIEVDDAVAIAEQVDV
jgi:Phage integrase family